MSDRTATEPTPPMPPASTEPMAHVRRSLGRALLKEARPKHWIKNGFLFAGIIFAKQLTNLSAIGHVLAAFALFCVVASAIYFLNDLRDRAADRLHPKKRFRPIAAGEISAPLAWTVALIGLGVAVPLALLLRPAFGLIIVGYVALQFAYTYWLKEQVLLDVFALATSFVLRAMAGAVVIAAPISPWLYVCTVLLSLCLGFAKRRHELMLLESGAGSHRAVLDEYSATLLEEIIAVVTSATVMAYALYTFNAENLPKNHAMMFTIPFVLYAVFRYLYLVYRKGEGGSPEEALFADRPLLVCIVLWAATSIAILYIL
ncbi:MAG: decaprenyl-phosphate phosphoribosyltransferase [Thermomicrobiales bacterium]